MSCKMLKLKCMIKKNKSFKNLIIILVFVFIASALFLYWFWSLGAINLQQNNRVVLKVVQGNVFVKHLNNEPEKVTSTIDLNVNDVVKTGSDGLAMINVYGQQVLRMDRDTELAIKDLKLEPQGKIVSIWNVHNGRVWSRLMKLLDVHSKYEVLSSDMVATVRGTAFNFEVTPQDSRVFVDQAGVFVKSKIGEKSFRVLAKGDKVRVDHKDNKMIYDINSSSTMALDARDNEPWFVQNRKLDGDFFDQVHQNFLNVLF